MQTFVQIVYFLTAVVFILGLKQMSSPKTARGGIVWAGIAMIAASLVAFLEPGVLAHGSNVLLIVIAIVVGSAVAYVTAKRVEMTDMPQMIAIYNGMGGGAAAAIAGVELVKVASSGAELATVAQVLAALGAIIGAVSFSGSGIAFAKLQGLMNKTIRLPMHQMMNLALFIATLATGAMIGFGGGDVSMGLVLIFFALALVLGIMVTMPIGGADMPVVISLFNAFTGLAVAFEGFVLQNAAMIIAGTVVGSSGTLLTQLMAKAMNRKITNVLFSSFGSSGGGEEESIEGSMKEIQGSDAAVMMAYAQKVIIIPGYGMAVAQAQHKVQELTQLLEEKGVTVKFAIHPVAGRMPGHMNVLLAEAGVEYDKIFDLDEINQEFPTADVALVIGANDVVNPVARSNPDSPIYGMPILDADKAKNCIVIKRGRGAGFSGIENHLFYADNTRMLYGDGQKAVGELIAGVKQM